MAEKWDKPHDSSLKFTSCSKIECSLDFCLKINCPRNSPDLKFMLQAHFEVFA